MITVGRIMMGQILKIIITISQILGIYGGPNFRNYDYNRLNFRIYGKSNCTILWTMRL